MKAPCIPNLFALYEGNPCPRESAPSTHFIFRWMVCRADENIVETRKKSVPFSGIEPWFSDHWAHNIVTVLDGLFRIPGLILAPHIHTNPVIHLVLHIVLGNFLWTKSELAILHVGMAWETVYSLWKSQIHVYRCNRHFFCRHYVPTACCGLFHVFVHS